IVALAALLAGCAPALREQLEGTWRSNRELTLVELSKASQLNEEQVRVLSAPEFFGDLTVIYRDGIETAILLGSEWKARYRIVEEGPDYLDVESWDSLAGERLTLRYRFRDGYLLVPVQELGFHEVFSRLPDR
ncbi:MAG: hypothetical protein JSU66_03675, partial [Deltaproteobacteria bacterium]